jgi:cyclopropane fatty-acyl-phospholipid synthase-like methyltransferase
MRVRDAVKGFTLFIPCGLATGFLIGGGRLPSAFGGLKMNEEFLTDTEYDDYFESLGGIRSRITADLPIPSGSRVLDLATGYGYFAIEIARHHQDVTVVGIDLCDNDVSNARKNIRDAGLEDRVESRMMDATNMSPEDASFDAAVNFLGLEDIHMTRGREGIRKTFAECRRVLRPGGLFCFVVMPPEEMETEAQLAEVNLFSYLCGATWLKRDEYERDLQCSGFTPCRNQKYHTGRKLSAQQARREIRFACEHVLRLYGIEPRKHDDVWSRFGETIEKNGLGHYSAVMLMITHKRKDEETRSESAEQRVALDRRLRSGK